MCPGVTVWKHKRVTRKQIHDIAFGQRFAKNIKTLILKDFKKLARHLLYLLHNKNKKRQTHKNKTYRL